MLEQWRVEFSDSGISESLVFGGLCFIPCVDSPGYCFLYQNTFLRVTRAVRCSNVSLDIMALLSSKRSGKTDNSSVVSDPDTNDQIRVDIRHHRRVVRPA